MTNVFEKIATKLYHDASAKSIADVKQLIKDIQVSPEQFLFELMPDRIPDDTEDYQFASCMPIEHYCPQFETFSF